MNLPKVKSIGKNQQILSAATCLFTELGYAKTSMDAIAKKADVSKQTVYSHFGNKDELFAAAIKEKCESYHILEWSADSITDAYSILFELALRFLDMMVSKEALAVRRICAFESESYPKLSQLFFTAGPKRMFDELGELMQLLVDKKLLTIQNTHFAALQYLNMIQGEACLRAEYNIDPQISQDEINEYLASSVKLFIKGYSC